MTQPRARAARQSWGARAFRTCRVEMLERRLLLTTALSFDSVPRGYGVPDFKPTIQAVGNFDGNSIPDLVVSDARYSGQEDSFTLRILLGTGDGNFTLGGSKIVAAPPLGFALGDFNRDGNLDVLTTQTAGDGFSIHLGNGNGTLQATSTFYADNPASGVVARDLNGDTKLDLAFSAGSAPCHVYLGNGDGTFTFVVGPGGEGTSGVLLPREQSAIAAQDVNGDGKVDLITTDASPTNTKVHVALGKGDGHFFASQTFSTALPAGQIVLADMNEDGHDDLVMAEGLFDGFVGAVKFGNGDGTFGPDLLLQQSYWARTVGVADFDGDFHLDIAFSATKLGFSERTKSVFFRRGDGNGGFGPEESRLISDAEDPSYISVADFNRDGRPDISASLSHSADDVYTLINTAPLQNAIQGLVFNDDNKNQLADLLEPGLSGRKVFDDVDNDGAIDPGEQFTVTRADGTYTLAVPDGAHQIRALLPPAWTQTYPAPTLNSNLPTAQLVSVSGHQTRAGLFFGTYFRGTISGTLWNDSNASGVREYFEDAPIPLQRTLYVDANDSGTLDAGETSALTDPQGVYRFILPPGEYRVRQLLPAGWFQTDPYTPPGAAKTGASYYVIGPGQVSIDQDYGSTRLGGISGRVFYDVDADLIANDSDPGQSGFKVFVDANFSGAFDTGEAFTFTDATGHYSLANLYPGSYAVGVIKPAGWEQTLPAGAPGTRQERVIGGLGEAGGNADFGVIRPSFVSGRVFDDADASGVQNGAEAGLAQWMVFVDTNGNGYGDYSEPLAQTSAQGDYTLRVPLDGTYAVRVVRRSGWQSTVPATGAHTLSFANNVQFSGKNFGLTQGPLNNAGFRPPVNFASGTGSFVNPISVATGHFNADTNLDFVVANNASDITRFLGNGAGGFSSASAGFGGSAMRAIIAIDVSGDGKLDLVTANQDDGTVSVLIGAGNGTFAPRVDYAAVIGAYCVTAGQFDGDTKLDLAVGGKNTDQLAILRGNGDGTFQAPLAATAGLGVVSIAVADFNEDGKLDLATANESGGPNSTGNTTVLLGNGNATFQPPIALSTGIVQPSAIAVGDFNNDANVDLVVANQFSDNVRVIGGLGNGTFNSGASYGTGAIPSHIAVADIDRDGWADLAIACRSDGTTDLSGGVNILRNRGDGTFEAPLTSTAHTSPTAVSVADFNNDAMPDLAAPNYFSDDVSVMINDRPAPSGLISGTVFDDLNGNGTREGNEGGVASRVVFLDTDNDTSLDPGETQTTTDAAGQFTFPPLAPGAYVIRLVVDPAWSQTSPAAGAAHSLALAAGANASLLFGLHDVRSPAIFAAQFLYESGPISIRVDFDENVAASLAAGDLQLTNLTTGQVIPPAQVILSYTAATGVASFTFSGNVLPDGNYRATLPASQVTDASSNALAESLTLDFFVFAGDANRDRAVNFFDLTALAANYGQSNKALADGDFNGDGMVNFFDLTALAANYGVTLPAPSEPVADVAVTAASEPLAPSASEPVTPLESSAPITAASVVAPVDPSDAVAELVAAPLSAPLPRSVAARRAHADTPRAAAASDPPRPGPVVEIRRVDPQPAPAVPAPLPPSPFAGKPRKRLPGNGIFSDTRVIAKEFK